MIDGLFRNQEESLRFDLDRIRNRESDLQSKVKELECQIVDLKEQLKIKLDIPLPPNHPEEKLMVVNGYLKALMDRHLRQESLNAGIYVSFDTLKDLINKSNP